MHGGTGNQLDQELKLYIFLRDDSSFTRCASRRGTKLPTFIYALCTMADDASSSIQAFPLIGHALDSGDPNSNASNAFIAFLYKYKSLAFGTVQVKVLNVHKNMDDIGGMHMFITHLLVLNNACKCDNNPTHNNNPIRVCAAPVRLALSDNKNNGIACSTLICHRQIASQQVDA
uniref:Uncharacterized protein n=1 Tax=Glossina pallidipes TaxID=7398 RepID=A0A1B0AD30_GLOPL